MPSWTRLHQNRRGVRAVHKEITITDATDATLNVFCTTGELGTLFGRNCKINDWFTVTGTGDTTDNALQTAKGSALVNGDRFKVTATGTYAVEFLGNFPT